MKAFFPEFSLKTRNIYAFTKNSKFIYGNPNSKTRSIRNRHVWYYLILSELRIMINSQAVS
jgi:hypothetical protein